MLERQQDFARQPGGAVLDGRDIGTVIAPDADVKLFVTATPEVRAERRMRELEGRGMHAHYDEVLADIHARDERDSSREAAPLQAGAGCASARYERVRRRGGHRRSAAAGRGPAGERLSESVYFIFTQPRHCAPSGGGAVDGRSTIRQRESLPAAI